MTAAMRHLFFLGLLAALGGCSAPAPAQPSLAGTSSQSIAIQSMDDAQETTRPEERSRYVVTFATNGRAAFRLD